MTVSTTTSRIEYVGNGFTTIFSVPFRFLENGHVFVILVDSLGAQIPQSEGSNYTLTGADDDAGGTLVMLVAPETSSRLIIYREVPATQETDYISGDPFPAESHERALDKLTMLVQQGMGGTDNIVRSLNFPIGDLDSQVGELPAALTRANKVLAFDANGRPIVTVPSDQSATALQLALASATGSTMVGDRYSVLARTRTVRQRFADVISAKEFAVGDYTTDDQAGLQRALDECYATGKRLYLPAGLYRMSPNPADPTCMLLNRGVSIIGEGRGSVLAPSALSGTGVAFMKVKPLPGAFIDMLRFEDFMIYPNANGVATYGGRAIYMDFTASCFVGMLKMNNVYCANGNQISLEIENSIATNPNGNPSNSDIRGCAFYEGIKAFGIGDSITMHGNIHRCTTGTGRHGVELYLVDGGAGVASHVIIERGNFGVEGGAIKLNRGRNIKIRDCNIEHSAGAGSNGAVIDIDGSAGVLPWTEVKSNHIAIFGTSTASALVRVNGSIGAIIEENTMLAGITVANAINITSSALNTLLGFNEIGSNFTTKINNLGAGTRNYSVALTLTGGATNVGGSYGPGSVFKDRSGCTFLDGLLALPGTPDGVAIATVPAGYRPPYNQRFSCVATVSGLRSPQSIEIAASTGVVTYYGSNSATQVSLAGIGYSTQAHVDNTF